MANVKVSRPSRTKRWQAEQQLRLLVDGLVDHSLYMLSADGNVSSWNSGAQRIKGYREDEIIGRHFSCFFTPEDRLAGKPMRALAIAEREGRYDTEDIRVRKDGSRFWASVVINALRDPDGDLIGFAKITRDITRRVEDAERIKETTRNLDLALSNMSQGFCLFDPAGRLLLANRRTNEIFDIGEDALPPGRSFEEVIGLMANGARRRDDLVARVDANLLARRHRDLVRRGERRIALEQLPPDRTVSVAHRVLAGGGWLSTFEDVTERRRAETKIQHMARHDALTGLPNRASFQEHLAAELYRAAHTDERIALIGVDMNRFKEINDLHGHAVGDRFLIELSVRLRDLLRENEFVARLGGDEFAAAIRFAEDARMHDFVGRLEVAFVTRVDIDGLIIGKGAAIGVSVFPRDGGNSEQLVNNADLAMYRAKGQFGPQICFYEARMDEVVRERRAMAGEIWRALEMCQFEIDYQPQRSIKSGETVGFEALLRWKHPERGLINPDDFVPIAEECGAIVQIGEFVMRTACRAAAGWDHPVKVAVNVSPLQIAHGNLSALVESALAESGLAGHRLELEITESTLISDKERTMDVLTRLRSFGVSVALDDFGTGYSSLDTLKSFPFNKIKLDRSFMHEVTASARARAVIRAMLALGHSLSIPVLAEGIETDEQMMLLREEGCDEGQGYLIGRPGPIQAGHAHGGP